MSSVWPAILFRKAVWLPGSITLTAIPSVPLATRSFKVVVCSAEPPLDVMRKSTSTFPSSLAAALQPAFAKLQKLAELLETNASFNFLAGAGADVSFWFLPQPVMMVATHIARNRDWIFFINGTAYIFGIIIRRRIC